MKLVLDTNVLVAALNFDGICRLLLKRAVRQDDLFTSAHLLDELSRILVKKFAWTKERAGEAASLFRERFSVVVPTPLDHPVCRDPDDDHVISTAIAANADAVISGDKDLLELRAHRGIQFVAPRAYWDLMERQNPGTED